MNVSSWSIVYICTTYCSVELSNFQGTTKFNFINTHMLLNLTFLTVSAVPNVYNPDTLMKYILWFLLLVIETNNSDLKRPTYLCRGESSKIKKNCLLVIIILGVVIRFTVKLGNYNTLSVLTKLCFSSLLSGHVWS